MAATAASGDASQPGTVATQAVRGRLTVPGRPDHVSEARALVIKALGDLHPRLDDAVLMVSELVTNAIVHSNSRRPGGTVTVTVLDSADGVRVEVADCGSEVSTPVVRADRYAAEGHGLFLVQSLADQWGYLRGDASTTVWFWLTQTWAAGQP